MTLFRLRWWWRVLWGLCPRCNSDAPEIDNCPVCARHRTPFPPKWYTRMMWLANAEASRDSMRIVMWCEEPKP